MYFRNYQLYQYIHSHDVWISFPRAFCLFIIKHICIYTQTDTCTNICDSKQMPRTQHRNACVAENDK